MSDREKCEDCRHCREVKSASRQTVYHVCDYPVPDWALPNAVVYPTHYRTCPVHETKEAFETKSKNSA